MTIDRILKSSIHHHGYVVICEWKRDIRRHFADEQQLAVAIFDKSHIIIIVTHVRCDFDLAEFFLIKSLPYQWYQSAKGLLLL